MISYIKKTKLKVENTPCFANVKLIENGMNGMAENVNIIANTKYNIRVGFHLFILKPLFIILSSKNNSYMASIIT